MRGNSSAVPLWDQKISISVYSYDLRYNYKHPNNKNTSIEKNTHDGCKLDIVNSKQQVDHLKIDNDKMFNKSINYFQYKMTLLCRHAVKFTWIEK